MADNSTIYSTGYMPGTPTTAGPSDEGMPTASPDNSTVGSPAYWPGANMNPGDADGVTAHTMEPVDYNASSDGGTFSSLRSR